ncbi:hypothetical protein FRAHR75_1970007 [Frankia sp. Hr75.2]|nr:hypothetical protein FRAHR75_1970007 [Frankia sp. Hr75.2]
MTSQNADAGGAARATPNGAPSGPTARDGAPPPFGRHPIGASDRPPVRRVGASHGVTATSRLLERRTVHV